METILLAFVVPAVAVVLDSLFGDPQTFPYPVRYIGKGLDLFETFIRKTQINLWIAGWIAMLLFSMIALGIAEFLMSIPYLGIFFAIYLAYAGLALGCLIKESRQVVAVLDRGNLVEARKALSMLVSRDTTALDANEIRRTLAETISENLNDGFVAPMFYLSIFGPGGLWVYKTVSTMDSMWGYKTERFKNLGHAAAKTDDVLAYIPARLTAWLLLLVGKKHGLLYREAKANFVTDAVKMESPNAGWPMAATAWLFDGQMGGKTVYFGQTKDKPVLGPIGKEWSDSMIHSLLQISNSVGHYAAAVFILALGWIQIAF